MGDSTEPVMSANTSVPDSKVSNDQPNQKCLKSTLLQISSALEDRIRKLLRSPSHKVMSSPKETNVPLKLKTQ